MGKVFEPGALPEYEISLSRRMAVLEFLRKWASLLVVAVILLPVTLKPPYHNGPAIRSDGLGYHLWTRAILEWDITTSFCKWPALRQHGAISWEDRQRGVCLNKYPPGLALLRFPVMGPLVHRDVSEPLVSRGEHRASLFLGALLLIVVCALSLASTRMLGVSAWHAHLAVLTVVFGSGLFHYATYDGSFTHIYSASLFALLIWLWLRHRLRQVPLPWTALAIVAFFLVLIRPTNLLALALLCAGHGCVKLREAQTRWLRTAIYDVSSVAVGAVLAWGLDVAYMSYVTRALTFSSYGNEHFHFDRPMQLSVLASYERGLFTFYPVLAVGFLAGMMVKRTRAATLWISLIFAAYVALYGYWESWMLGLGFGHRGFVEFTPFIIVVLASASSELPRWRNEIMVATTVCAFATLELMRGYWFGTLPLGGVTARLYWWNLLGKYSLFSWLYR
jgi:hypothetical protein